MQKIIVSQNENMFIDYNAVDSFMINALENKLYAKTKSGDLFIGTYYDEDAMKEIITDIIEKMDETDEKIYYYMP